MRNQAFDYTLTLTLGIALVAGPALGQSAIGLEGVEASPATSFGGRCGQAVVRVVNVPGIVAETFQIDADTEIVVQNWSGKRLRVTPSGENNGVSCVSTPAGKRLLVHGDCGISHCDGDLSFIVIDPDTLAILSPDRAKLECFADCAAKIIGTKEPVEIEARLAAGPR